MSLDPVTERLRAERPDPRHRSFAAELFGREDVARWHFPHLGGVRTPRQAAEIVDRQAAHWDAHGFGFWWWRRRGDADLIGEIGLQHTIVDGIAGVEVGWSVHPRHQGEGLATEAARAALERARDVLGLRAVLALTLTTNEASLNVMRKLGADTPVEVSHVGLPHLLHWIRLG